jgi:hypothetical protein
MAVLSPNATGTVQGFTAMSIFRSAFAAAFLLPAAAGAVLVRPAFDGQGPSASAILTPASQTARIEVPAVGVLEGRFLVTARVEQTLPWMASSVFVEFPGSGHPGVRLTVQPDAPEASALVELDPAHAAAVVTQSGNHVATAAVSAPPPGVRVPSPDVVVTLRWKRAF